MTGNTHLNGHGPEPTIRPPLMGKDIVRRIEKALLRSGGTHTWSDVRQMLITGEAQIFYNAYGAWITQIYNFPQKRVLHAWIVAGVLPEVMELQEQVIDYARTMTCSEVTAVARHGWRDIARHYGWHDHSMMIHHPVPKD